MSLVDDRYIYRGDGLDEESSSCKCVGMDMGGNGMDCGIGEGGESNDGNFPVAMADFGRLISRGSGRVLIGIGFRFGEVCPFENDGIRALEACGVDSPRLE